MLELPPKLFQGRGVRNLLALRRQLLRPKRLGCVRPVHTVRRLDAVAVARSVTVIIRLGLSERVAVSLRVLVTSVVGLRIAVSVTVVR